VVFFINTIETIVFKLHFGFAVTIHTPTHTQVRELLYFIHFLNFSMAGLTGYLSGIHVLGMVKVYVVRQVMDSDPFDGLGS
jgi:hypothetical protein